MVRNRQRWRAARRAARVVAGAIARVAVAVVAPAAVAAVALAGAGPAPARAAEPKPAATKPAAPAKPPAPPPLVAESLGKGLWRIAGDEAGGVLVLEGADGLLLVDTQDPKRARDLDAALARLSRRPVRFVVNTHYHEDHVGGNARYRAKGAAVIAHASVPAQMAKDTVIADWGDWHRQAAPAAAFPTLTFHDSLALDVGGERVVAFHVPAAHSDGDVMVWLPARDLLHAGDVVEVDAPPFVDLWAGGTFDGLIAAVDRVLAMSGPATRIVPGHGRIVDRAWVAGYREMLETARSSARAALAAGQGAREYLDTKPLAAWNELLGGERRARQVAALAYRAAGGAWK